MTHGIDHVSMTVPDMEAATLFFQNIFQARIVVEGLKETDAPWGGPSVETAFGLPEGSRVRARRVLSLGRGANIELFCFDYVDHAQAAHTYDYGLQHFAVYVDNLQNTASKFLKAGGVLLADSTYIEAVKKGRGPGEGWLYGKTPWGTVIEMVTFQEGR